MKKLDTVWFVLGIVLTCHVLYRWHQDATKYDDLERAINDLKFVTQLYRTEVCRRFDVTLEECKP